MSKELRISRNERASLTTGELMQKVRDFCDLHKGKIIEGYTDSLTLESVYLVRDQEGADSNSASPTK